jgi:hypothetical protein
MSNSRSILHRGSGSHWILATDTNPIEKKRPGVADNPAIEIAAPGCCEHDETEKHDNGVLNQTPATANPEALLGYGEPKEESFSPIAQNTNNGLAEDNSYNLKVYNGSNPLLVTNEIGLHPTISPYGFKQRHQISNREQDITIPINAVTLTIKDEGKEITYPSSPNPAPGSTACLKYHVAGLKIFLIIFLIAVSSFLTSAASTRETKIKRSRSVRSAQ